MENMDKILRIYSRLVALQKNLPSTVSINEKYVKEYNAIVNELENVSQSELFEFKILDSQAERMVTSVNYRTGDTNYSNERYCEKNYMLSKMEALIGYFNFRYFSEEKINIGFKPQV